MGTRENAKYIILANVGGKKTAIQVDGLYSILPPQTFPLKPPKEIQIEDERLPLYQAGALVALHEEGVSGRDGGYEKLYRELLAKVKELSDDMGRLKEAISEDFKTDLARITENDFPATADQLSAVMAATEKATHNIMDLTERVQESQKRLGDKFTGLRGVLEQIRKHEEEITEQLTDVEDITADNNADLTEIVTSLSFHDLTGQQLQKTMKLQSDMEEKLMSILVNYGIKLRRNENPGDEETIKRGERMLDLLQGPNKEAIDQAEVDLLLADFLK
ncbi:MAG: protein phosphatase CheZ [bacterium]|nr:protein phosphatase CheZ [bacterium]